MSDLTGRPLLASALDEELFVDREHELEVLERASRARLNALVLGDRGIGKTSLLHRLESRVVDQPEQVPVFVEGTRRVERPEDLLLLVAARLGAGQAQLSPLDELMQFVGKRPARTSTEAILTALTAIREGLGDASLRPLLILDELPSGEIAHVLFGQLRDELWSLPLTWVVAAEAGEQAGYLRPPASAFFETVITIDPLTDEQALDLLRRRVPEDVSESLLRDIVAAADGNPRRLINLVRDAVLEGRSVAATAVSRARRDELADELGDAASRAVAYLDANGPASASDERMLAELGWSRSRATQVLRELERAGLASPMSERSDRGRRKVYALTEPKDAT